MGKRYLALIFAFFVVNGVYGQTTRPVSMEQRLFTDIFTNYDKRVRPVLDSNKTVNISLGISLTMIAKVDERNQILTTNIKLEQEWFDPRLYWQEALYGQFSRLRIPCDLIWLPDIVLYNSAEDQSRSYHKAHAVVKSNGTVRWSPSVLFLSSCKMDITFFPFDDQICLLKLGSWAYDGWQVDVFRMHQKIDLKSFALSGEWEVQDTWIVRNVVYYPCCAEPYPDITFYIHMNRRAFYYIINIAVPCMFLSALTIFSFLLPPDSGEKVTMGLTILLAYSVFTLLVAENMPRTSEYIPLIGLYLIVSMGLTTSSVMFAVLVLNLHHRGITNQHPPPLLYLVIVRYIGRMVFVSQKSAEMFSKGIRSDYPTSLHSQTHRAKITTDDLVDSDLLPANEECRAMDFGTTSVGEDVEMTSSGTYAGVSNMNTSSNVAINPTKTTMFNYLKQMGLKQNRIREEAVCIREWQLMAFVLDRLLFGCFFIILLATNVYLLLIRPLFRPLRR